MARLLAPLRAGLTRTLLEGAAGFLVLLLIAQASNPTHHPPQGAAGAFLVVLAWFWLGLWPAWCLRPIAPGPLWRRVTLGVLRALLVAGLIAIIGTALDTALAWLTTASLTGNLRPVPRQSATPAIFLFLGARALFVGVVALRHYARQRLRRQLLVTHAAVVVLTIMLVSALASAVVPVAVERGTAPDAAAMALSARDLVALAQPADRLDAARVRSTLSAITTGTVQLRGQPLLDGIVGRTISPTSVLVVRPDGSVIAAAHPSTIPKRDVLTNVGGRATGVWQRVRSLALGHGVGTALLFRGPDAGIQQETLAAAPLFIGHRTAALVLVEAPSLSFTPQQLFPGIIAIFGAATISAVLATALPILALSFLFSYYVAKRLTRNLEAVSSVATSIASGDLSHRAPVQEENEIGALATDVNRMAGHLEEAMGELESARQEAVEALSAREVLVANISHELRTPLAIIRAHLENLVERQRIPAGSGVEEAEVVIPAPTLHALQSEAERLGSLIDDLFALSRVQTGALAVQSEVVDVGSLLGEVADLMRPLAQHESGIALSVQVPETPLRVVADPDRVRQILANLVRNAVRHTPDGGIIVLAAAPAGREVVISVADTGEGILPEHLPHVFERFYRADEARDRERGGAGLGLAIVRELVELMGGTVTVESMVGEGSIFRVSLPVAP